MVESERDEMPPEGVMGNPEGAGSEDAGEEDFSTLFEASLKEPKKRAQLHGKVTGTVVGIGGEWVFVDIGEKSEGIIALQELLDQDGKPSVALGDRITAYVMKKREGETLLSVRLTSAASGDALEGAYRSGVPVEGVVTAERKGGYQVKLLGKDAFCPYSQMDLRGVSDPDGYIGKRLPFRITAYDNAGRNIVLSRRAILEEEREQRVSELRKSLHVGDVVLGRVARLLPYGAFVDIGGIEGLIPIAELAWRRVESPSDVLAPGETVRVKIMDLDWKEGRITLSRKATLEDPRTTLAERYPEGMILVGEVVRLAPFGVFVQLPDGDTGLLHVSEMADGGAGDLRKRYPQGSSLKVQVLKTDPASGKIALSTKGLEAGEADQEFKAYRAGMAGTGSFGTLALAFEKAGEKRGRGR